MWESPIQIIENEMHNHWRMQMENGILKAVKNVGIDVDKEELMRALLYDRQQYDKGYADGVKEVCERIVARVHEYFVSEIDALPPEVKTIPHDLLRHNKQVSKIVKEEALHGFR